MPKLAGVYWAHTGGGGGLQCRGQVASTWMPDSKVACTLRSFRMFQPLEQACKGARSRTGDMEPQTTPGTPPQNARTVVACGFHRPAQVTTPTTKRPRGPTSCSRISYTATHSMYGIHCRLFLKIYQSQNPHSSLFHGRLCTPQ